eukprot:RCo043822
MCSDGDSVRSISGVALLDIALQTEGLTLEEKHNLLQRKFLLLSRNLVGDVGNDSETAVPQSAAYHTPVLDVLNGLDSCEGLSCAAHSDAAADLPSTTTSSSSSSSSSSSNSSSGVPMP